MKIHYSIFVFLLVAFQSAEADEINDLKEFFKPLPKMSHPADNPWSKEKEDLGKMLYFDPRLSGSNWISCATCHNPGLGWGDGLPRTIGDGQKELGRHSPSLFNIGDIKPLMWDGRAKNLEEQALGPIKSKAEMNQDLDALVDELAAIPGYSRLFKKAFPKEGLKSETIAKAIATFERSIVSRNSSYDDYFANGNNKAMSSSALNGMKLFSGKAKCAICHNGPNFTDNGFHNIGIKQSGPLKEDLGRYKISKDDFDKGAFKTPGLRDVSRTPPYMHDGGEATLEDVVEFYNRGGDVDKNKSPFISPLGLNAQEKKDLVEFMKTLDGEPIVVSIPELPHS